MRYFREFLRRVGDRFMAWLVPIEFFERGGGGER